MSERCRTSCQEYKNRINRVYSTFADYAQARCADVPAAQISGIHQDANECPGPKTEYNVVPVKLASVREFLGLAGTKIVTENICQNPSFK